MITAARSQPGYAAARPVWGEVDLGAISHNLDLLREVAGLQRSKASRILHQMRQKLRGIGCLRRAGNQVLQRGLNSSKQPVILRRTNR